MDINKTFDTFGSLPWSKIGAGLALFIISIFIIFWIYSGLKIFLDSKVRYESGFFMSLVFLVFGLVTGPIRLVIYNISKPKYTPEEIEYLRIEHKFYYQQASKVIDCVKCDSYVLEGQEYCTNCGTQNRFHCKNCNTLFDRHDLYCSGCGQKVQSPQFEEKQEVDEKTPQKERKSILDARKVVLARLRSSTKRYLIKAFGFGKKAVFTAKAAINKARARVRSKTKDDAKSK